MTEHRVLRSVDEYFNDTQLHPTALPMLRDILTRKEPVSLRLLDWFVSNFSRTHSVVIMGLGSVYASYRASLAMYGKKLFDAFRRAHKIKAFGIETSIGQLNFIKWAIQTGVVSWVILHKDDIQRDMVTTLATRRDQPSQKFRKFSRVSVKPTAMRGAVRIVFEL